jgi:hypothetical protein
VNWWPARVLLDGVDITNVPTDFSAHETGRLEVVFTQHPARIAGTVIDVSGQPVRAPWILVMSADPALQQEWAATNEVAQGNTKGRFSIAVMPGRTSSPLFRKRHSDSTRGSMPEKTSGSLRRAERQWRSQGATSQP